MHCQEIKGCKNTNVNRYFLVVYKAGCIKNIYTYCSYVNTPQDT